ncbi:hypothetical protein CHY_2487 [Carboxydothermus hydrogenoformans Z-2901]|uniref:Uncharacterized protein n=1 Tax=Carboxydothermus hydrogenoformans (strain ATCC BAA-161 / DSM 6008 / Z-2901) TaxID=246194 RepID=Q3A9A3_CARHZ|nr:hypothetical protein CHY_2487 [Carboxydothermus hydrogenoformans Z-2901]
MKRLLAGEANQPANFLKNLENFSLWVDKEAF